MDFTDNQQEGQMILNIGNLVIIDVSFVWTGVEVLYVEYR